MKSVSEIEDRIRQLRRPRVSPDVLARVLGAAQAPVPVDRTARLEPAWRWRFAAVTATLLAAVAGATWVASRTPAEPPPAFSRTAVLEPPGDDVVVFWLDDDTPVFVDLSESP